MVSGRMSLCISIDYTVWEIESNPWSNNNRIYLVYLGQIANNSVLNTPIDSAFGRPPRETPSARACSPGHLLQGIRHLFCRIVSIAAGYRCSTAMNGREEMKKRLH